MHYNDCRRCALTIGWVACTACSEAAPRFVDSENNRVLFLNQGIGEKYWGTFYRGPRGSLKRFKSPILPMRASREKAEAELRALASNRDWIEV